MGMPAMAPGVYKEYFGQEREKVFQGIYGARSDQAKLVFADQLEHLRVQYLKPMDGAAELLDVIQEMGLTCGVVTNKKGDFVRREIEILGWQNYFSCLIAAGDAARDKPYPDPLVMAMNQTEVLSHKELVWLVGDTDFDLACARDAGCVPVLIGQAQDLLPSSHFCAQEDRFFAFSCLSDIAVRLREYSNVI
jgi:phosphoglycolate phosphatase